MLRVCFAAACGRIIGIAVFRAGDAFRRSHFVQALHPSRAIGEGPCAYATISGRLFVFGCDALSPFRSSQHQHTSTLLQP